VAVSSEIGASEEAGRINAATPKAKPNNATMNQTDSLEDVGCADDVTEGGEVSNGSLAGGKSAVTGSFSIDIPTSASVSA
jgi:hypothetical protein